VMIKLTGATNHPATETPDLPCSALKLRLCSSFEYSFLFRSQLFPAAVPPRPGAPFQDERKFENRRPSRFSEVKSSPVALNDRKDAQQEAMRARDVVFFRSPVFPTMGKRRMEIIRQRQSFLWFRQFFTISLFHSYS